MKVIRYKQKAGGGVVAAGHKDPSTVADNFFLLKKATSVFTVIINLLLEWLFYRLSEVIYEAKSTYGKVFKNMKPLFFQKKKNKKNKQLLYPSVVLLSQNIIWVVYSIITSDLMQWESNNILSLYNLCLICRCWRSLEMHFENALKVLTFACEKL